MVKHRHTRKNRHYGGEIDTTAVTTTTDATVVPVDDEEQEQQQPTSLWGKLKSYFGGGRKRKTHRRKTHRRKAHRYTRKH